ncbi:MAG: hypothetical protein E6G41_09840 [Actinobacteria bacterium]|nr:MAG: hypothetical protein E6G41_09840 [Actinomycetota bacterium]
MRKSAAIIALVLGWALIMQSLGWAQTSYYAFVKSLSHGHTSIDAYHWETRDKSYINGHFYSVKAPGLALVLTPPFMALDAVGAPTLARKAADTARAGGARQWTYRGLNVHAYGYNAQRAAEIKRRLEIQAPMVWALGLFGTVLPALLLLLLTRRLVDRIEPGLGTLTAVTLGGATLVMPFAVNLFSHVLAALLAFAAFALAWRERERAEPNMRDIALAGVLAGLAVTTEYPLAIAGAIVGVYVALRGLRRAAVYAFGVVLGVLPLLIYNLLAFGSITTLSYKNAVNEQGRSGHETLGLNGDGLFGIGMPKPRYALELLLSPRGLVVVTPIVLMGLLGTVLLWRRGRRAEAGVIGAVVAAYFVYDAGYWLPMGGGSPGPRFLIPTLPFLAVGIAAAWRRWPGPTLALAVPSAVTMIAAAITYPLVTFGHTADWSQRASDANFQHTVLSLFGLDNGWLAVAPVLAAFLAAAVLAWRSAPRLRVGFSGWPVLAAWGLIAGYLAPRIGETVIAGRVVGPVGIVDHRGHGQLVVWALIATGISLAVAGWRSAKVVDDEAPTDRPRDPEPGDRSGPPVFPRRPRQPVGVQHHGPEPETT